MEGVVRREIGREEGERKDEKCWDKGKHDTHTHPPIEYHSSHVRKESPDQVHAHKIATCQRINLLLLCNRQYLSHVAWPTSRDCSVKPIFKDQTNL